MFNMLTGILCIGGGIYLIESAGRDNTAMSLVSGLLILFGVFRLIMLVLDTGDSNS
jgi:hypothetical protein